MFTDPPCDGADAVFVPETDGQARRVGGETQYENPRALAVQIGLDFGQRPALRNCRELVAHPDSFLLIRRRIQEKRKETFRRARTRFVAGRVGPEQSRRVADPNVLLAAALQQRVESRRVGKRGALRHRCVRSPFLAERLEGILVERHDGGAGALGAGNTFHGRMQARNGGLLSGTRHRPFAPSSTAK